MAQTTPDTWGWVGGSTTWVTSGTYGTLGTGAASNLPGARTNSITWIDSKGRMWLFGGSGYDSAGGSGYLNDLWFFDPSAGTHGTWTWMGGSKTNGQSGSRGTRGVFNTTNAPSARQSAVSWFDSKGHLWLFGGQGMLNGTKNVYLNDLWEFDSTLGTHGEWAWIGGSSATKPAGVYGTRGTASTTAWPGGRLSAAAGKDAQGRLWLFGGYGYDSASVLGYMNDLWVFQPSLGTNGEWTWMGGSSSLPTGCSVSKGNCGINGVYGEEQAFSDSYVPSSRYLSAFWSDKNGHIWVFGGIGFDDSSTSAGYLSDLWEFDPTLGKYGRWAIITGTASKDNNSGYPKPRAMAQFWSDSYGNLWLFGGWYGASSASNHRLYDTQVFYPTSMEWQPGGGEGVGGKFDYGSEYEFSTDIFPGFREEAATWVDTSNHVWLFSGMGTALFPDLWENVPLGTNSTPQFSLKAGVYTAGKKQSVTITDATSGASIYYTTDGTVPKNSSDTSYLYTNAISIAPPMRLRAIAATNVGDNLDSPVQSAVYASTQSISFATPVTQYVGKTLELAAKATSGLAVTYQSKTTAVCTVSGSTASFVAAGTCTLLASQAGNTYYGAATAVSVGFTAAKQSQTITFANPGEQLLSKTLTLSGAASSGLTVNYSTSTPKVCKVSGTATTFLAAGTCTVAATQSGNGTWLAATAVVQSFAVKTKTQSIVFTQPTSPVAYGVSPILMSATASSGLAVSYSVVSGPGKLTGSKLTVQGAGTIVVRAAQTGNSVYMAAASATRKLVVNKVELTVTAADKTKKLGAALPTLTYTITGFVNSDTQKTATTGAPQLSTTATASSKAGQYLILVDAGTLAATNYTFSYVNGTLTVTK